jgi:hypothetical protein
VPYHQKCYIFILLFLANHPFANTKHKTGGCFKNRITPVEKPAILKSAIKIFDRAESAAG